MIISEYIYKGLAWLGEDGIVWVVSGFLIFLFVSGWFSKHEQVRRTAPALMVSLGILGTFCGIYLALYPLEFAPDKINDSIRSLLDGMKTAFVTSLLGISVAIIFRSTASWRKKQAQTSPEQREVVERLDAIKQAISGEGDSSLVTQIQKMRDENRDGFNKLDGLSETIRETLVKNLEGLIAEIRDIIGKQLGESLQNLINNIEEALIKQFGATFVQFNEATQAIKKWQEEHRGQVEQLTNAFNMAAQGIVQIRQECENIPLTMEQLREVVGIAHHDVELLNQQVKTFAEMRQQAEQSFPTIKQHLDKIGADLAASATGFDGLENTIRSTYKSAEEVAALHLTNVETLATNMRETLENAQRESAEKVAGIIQGAIGDWTTEINKELHRVASAWGEQMIAIADQYAKVIEEHDSARQ